MDEVVDQVEMHVWRFKPGDRVKDFEIVRPIGDGGMGEVYLAEELTLRRKVALKVIKESADLTSKVIWRFLREAINTARVTHPNIVVVYSSGTINHRGHTLPFVALEYLENGDLERRIRAEDLKQPDDVINLGCQVAAALHTAHNAGIHHRDLKPGNLVFDSDMRLRVVDFGLAKAMRGARSVSFRHDLEVELEDEGLICGTPAYMAPEQWMGTQTGSFTDVWALGVILYEMATYDIPFQAASARELQQRVCKDYVPDWSLMDHSPRALVKLVQDCLEREPDRRPTTVEVLARMEGILEGKPRLYSRDEPFRGLLTFEEHHEKIFFGRDQEVADFTELMQRCGILTLMGPSGTGKSSLVKAGILPRLREASNPCVVSMRPGNQPMLVLAEELARRLEATDETAPSLAMDADATQEESRSVELARAFQESPTRLLEVLLQMADSCGQPVLLFIDQLEELVTLVGEAERCAFLAAIAAVGTAADPRARVIQTVRDGFVGKLMQENIGGDPLGRVEVVKPPGKDKLLEVLLRPLEQVDYAFEDEELPREMMEEVAGGAACLPLLQFAGQRLWAGRDKSSRLLLRSVYEDAGGVAGMLAHYAESVVPRSRQGDYQLAKGLLLRMVTPERTKRSRSEEKLLQGMDERAAVVLRKLVEGRLVTVQQGPQGEREYELIHESLITSWDLLAGWIDLHDEDLLNLSGLLRGAETWDAEGRPWARLLWGKPLTAALAWRSRCKLDVPPIVEDFLQASRARWRGLWSIVGVVVLLVMAGLALLALQYAREAEAAREASTLAEARRVEAERQRAAVQREGARAALARGDLLQARGQLRASMETELSLQGRAIWWEINRTSQIWSRDLGANPHDLVFMPGGKSIAAASQDGTVQFIDATTGLVSEVLRDHTDQVLSIAVSRDGRHLASASWGGLIKLRDLKARTVKVLRGHQAEVWSLAFSPDGSQLASAGNDRVVRLWSVPRGEPVGTLKGHEHFVRALAYSSSGDHLVSAGLDNMIRIWDTASKKELGHVSKEGLRILTVAISPDNKLVAAGGAGEGVWLWDVLGAGKLSAEARLAPFSTKDAVRRLRFDSGGKLLAATGWDGSVQVWNLNPGDLPRRLGSHGKRAPGLAFSPDGKTLATSGIDHTVRLWDVRKLGALPSGLGHTDGVMTGAVDPAGKLMATGGEDGTIRLWDLGSGEEVRVIKGRGGTVTSVAFSPDGKTLAAGSGDHAVRLWDPATGTMMKVLLGHTASVRCVRFAPDGRRLGSVSVDRTVRLWDTSSGLEVRRVEQHESAVMTLAFSPVGDLAASGDSGGFIAIWRPSSGQLVRTVKGHTRGVSGLDFGPRGKQIVSGSWDGAVKAWAVATGEGRELARAEARVYRLDLSPDGSLVGVPYSDGTARLIPMAGGAPRVLRGHGAEVNSLRFSDDGKLAVTASDDGTARVWDTATGRPAWRSTLLMASGKSPKVLSHRGWTRPGGKILETGMPEGTGWLAALKDRARIASEAPGGGRVCLLTNSDEVELWDQAADRQIFNEQEKAPLEVMALKGGCLVRTLEGTRLYNTDGAARDLGLRADAMAPDGDGFLLAGEEKVWFMDPSGARLQDKKVGPHVAAISRLGQRLFLGYRDGSIESVAAEGGAPGTKQRLRGTYSSQVVRLGAGLKGTIIAGYANGQWGIWDVSSGQRMLQGRLHGPVDSILLRGTQLSLVTRLGHSASLDLKEFQRTECDIIRDAWSRIPVVWVGGEPYARPAPRGHRCSPGVKARPSAGKEGKI